MVLVRPLVKLERQPSCETILSAVIGAGTLLELEGAGRHDPGG